MKTLLMSTVATVFAAGAAFADMSWDSNADGMIDADEFAAGMAADTTFTAYDTDGDGMLSPDEYHAGNWKAFDEDADGMWSETEVGAFRDAALRAGAEVSK